jgi:hypothetical protein
MAETIQDWIIALKYQVDEQSARRVEDIARRLRAGQEVTSREMRELEKGMKGLARTHETSMRQMSQSAQQHGQRFSTVVNQVIHPSLTKITAALGALSTAVGGFKAFEGVVKNLQQVGDLSRDLNVTALSLNALDKSLQNIGANRGTAASLVTTLQDAVQKNRGNLVLLQGMGVTARDNAERVIELSRFVKREAAANRFDIAVQRIAEIGYSVADARRMLALSEEDYRRQQAIRQRWKLDSADDIKTAQKLRSEWTDLMSNMEGVQNAIFIPMMKTVTTLIGEVNRAIEGHEDEIRAFFTAITEPIAGWAQGKAEEMLAYMKKLTGPDGAQERAAWVKWWQDTKKETNDVVKDILTIVHGVSEAIQLLSRLNRARRENIERVENEEIDKAESRRRDQQRDYKPGFPGKQVPARHRPYTGLERFMRHLPYGEELLRRNREIAEAREAEAASPSVNTTAPTTAPVIGHGRLGGAVGATGGLVQQQRQQEEEVRATTDNTEEIKKNTQELQEQRRSSRGFFGTGIDWIKNLVGMGGAQAGTGEGGPPDISGRGVVGGSGGAAGGGGTGGSGSPGETGPGAVGGRKDRGGFESNAPGADASGASMPNIPKAGDVKRAIQGFIVHHTAGRGTIAGVENTLQQRGLGVHYIMDREGNIKAVTPEGQKASHIQIGRGKGAGLSNLNTVGMEIIAKNDADVTPKQVAAFKRFWGAWSKEHPGAGIFGHGEVNPGHKEATEGLTVANAVRESIRRGEFQGGAGGAGGAALPAGQGLQPGFAEGYGNKANISQVRQYIRSAAVARGIDPDIALKVAESEGLHRYTGDQGTSFGPYQLHYAGGTGRNATGGLGNEFTRKTGLDARDPSTWKAQVDFSLDQAKRGGWGPWHGWRGPARAGLNAGPSLGDNQRPLDATVGAPPIATPPNVANDNSRSVTQTNEYKTTINAEDARGAASIFKGAAENINRLNMSQIKGVIR